jgi:hypothetical protein
MSNCESGANSQLKVLQARLDRVDDDLAAHYAGISTIVMGLASNPITASAVVKVAPIYNLTPIGQTLIKELKGMLPGADKFKSLQHVESASMIEGMASKLAASAANAAISAGEQRVAALESQAMAVAALAEALKSGKTELELAPFREEVAQANASVGQALAVIGMLESFMKTLSDIADCRTRTQILTP